MSSPVGDGDIKFGPGAGPWSVSEFTLRSEQAKAKIYPMILTPYRKFKSGNYLQLVLMPNPSEDHLRLMSKKGKLIERLPWTGVFL